MNNKWALSSKGEYTVAEGYSWLLPDAIKVPWRYWVWNRLSIPKHAFISWLVMWGRLKTKQKLFQIGVSTDDACAICGMQTETISHLFLNANMPRCVLGLYSNGCICIISVEMYISYINEYTGRAKPKTLENRLQGLH